MTSRVAPAPRAGHQRFARRCCSTWNTDIAGDWRVVGRIAVRQYKFNCKPHWQIGRAEARALGAARVTSISRETTCATAIWQMSSFPAWRCRLTQAAALTDSSRTRSGWSIHPACDQASAMLAASSREIVLLKRFVESVGNRVAHRAPIPAPPFLITIRCLVSTTRLPRIINTCSSFCSLF